MTEVNRGASLAVSTLTLVYVLLGCSAADAAHADADYYVYVTNERSNDLSVIDPRSDEVTETIEVGRRPRGVHVTSDGRYVFVALSGSPFCPPTMSDEECAQKKADKSMDGIAMIDARSRQVLRVLPGGSDPEQFDIGPDAARLYISNEDANAASIVEVDSGRVLATVDVGREPEGIRVSPDGSVFLTTSESDHAVAVADTDTFKVLARVDVGLRPRDILFNGDGTRAFVSAELGRHVSVLDTGSWRVIKEIPLGETDRPMGLAVTEDSRTLYVANGRGGTLSKIDLESGKVVDSVAVGARPWGLALSHDEKRLYTANGPSNDVAVVDVATLRVLTRIAVGDSPWGVAIGKRP